MIITTLLIRDQVCSSSISAKMLCNATPQDCLIVTHGGRKQTVSASKCHSMYFSKHKHVCSMGENTAIAIS